MPRYYLTKIAIEGFRGINNEGDPLVLRFQPDTVNSVFAVNGIGKSSIFEALSYAIRGDIPKLQELRSNENPADYYCNRFHSAGHATIDLDFSADDGSADVVSVRVERDVLGRRTVSSPSGHANPGAFLEDLNENFALLDYRTFARFIDDSPLERGRSFSALLGLSAYSDFRQSLQAASDTRALNSDLDIRVLKATITSAQEASQQALAVIRNSYEQITGERFEDVDKLQDYMAKVVRALAGVELLKTHFEGGALADIDFEAVKEAIRAAEGGEKRKQLETTIESLVSLDALGKPDTDACEAEKERLLTLVDERDALLGATQGDLVRRLFEAANNVIAGGEWSNDENCMLCDSDLQISISAHVKSKLSEYSNVSEKTAALRKAWKDSHLAKRLSLLEKATILEVTEQDAVATTLASRVRSGEIGRDEIENAAKRVAALDELLVKKGNELKETKETLEKTLPASLVRLTEQVEHGRQCKINAETYRRKQTEESLAAKRLQVRKRWKTFINRATDAFAEAEAALSRKKISDIDSEYKGMFKQIMNVGDVVPDLQRARDREDLHVQLSEFHGQHTLSARALLSESYRNALAISVFLSAALKHAGSPRFVVLDDVTSSFDSGHQYALMELIRQKLQHPANADGLQFVMLSHDGLLEKYFDRLSSTTSWNHHRLQGAPPMGQVLGQAQDANRLRTNIVNLLSAGQITQAEHLIRQYLEYKLQQIIRKVNIPVPIDFAMRDQTRMVSNCIDAITNAVRLQQAAGTLSLDTQQVTDFDTVHVPAILGNWVSHYETGAGTSLSAPALQGVVNTIDDLAECFRYDDTSSGTLVRRWHRSLER